MHNLDYASDEDYGEPDDFGQLGHSHSKQNNDQEIDDKIAIILSIKVEEMSRKLKILAN